ncbi:hypothetical protein COCON_G00223370 [Conger conger]|uniref:Cilia- and flagella-associated protein 46 n=1 Tax=Conger conger TaxID=82655 RepID=A0A9Q1CVN9_CONCO|nr:hypothetical protein COCON_G00223370 [Conger conger]
MDLQIRQLLAKAETQKDADALKKAYDLINEGTKEKAASGGRCFCPELYVLCAEQAFQLGQAEITETCLMMYFKGKPPTNQFLCRAYLCQGQLRARASESVDDVQKAVMYFLKAIEVSKEQPRYHFLVFNASVLYLQSVGPFLRPGSRPRLHASLTQVLRALEEVGETDHRWRAELMLLLIECLVEAGKMKEAASWGKATADFIGAHTPDLYPRIFTLQVQHKLLDLSRSPKKAEESLTLSVIYRMQKLKHHVGGSARKDDGSKLKEIFLLLTNPTAARTPGSSPGLPENMLSITPGERASFLLELGHLALRLNVPQMTADCLSELKRAGLSDAGHLIAVECLRCEQELHKRGPRIEEYKRSDVEAQQKLVSRLDQLLQNALRGAGQTLCRGKPLLRLAQVLEDSNSTLLDLRCQVHSEVGVLEAEEDHIEAAIQHVQKALRLDARGEHQERLSANLHALRLRALLYETPERSEDRAAMIIQQARTAGSRDSRRKVRAMLVNAGTALAPEEFRAVLDADKAPKGGAAGTAVSQLAAKAQHHTAGVQQAEGHLRRQGDRKDPERVRLWAELAKVSRKLEAWSVCRAACRFCLLHDDSCRETPISNGESKEGESSADTSRRGSLICATERDLLRLLAEVHFINAEATVQKLRVEGVQLNAAPIPPPQRPKRPAEGASGHQEDDALWTAYRDWVQNLSAYATDSFLRAAELGAELGEAWIVSNAAVYLWNYNSHALASGGQRHLVVTFQTLIELLKKTGHSGQVQLLALLCNSVAQGLIQPWIPSPSEPAPETQDSERAPPSRARKVAEKRGSVLGQPLEPGGTLDVRKALELCEYALRLTNGSASADSVSVATRKRVIGTWVRTKQLLQQQIGQKLDFEEESKSTEVTALWRVLVSVEMLVCNSSSRLMEFSVPSAGELVRMAAECVWVEPLVELQVWTHLAHFSHQAQEQELVITCSQNALRLEAQALKKLKITSLALYSSRQLYEMLSSVACLRGQSLLQKSKGHPGLYREALLTLQSSVSYGEKAGSQALCMVGARHYWNSCLPLLRTPQDRQQLQSSVEKILRSMASTSSTEGKDEGARIPVKLASESSLGAGIPSLEISGAVTRGDDLTLRAAFYGLLFCIHGDRNDWRAGLKVLDQAVREMPRTKHRLLLFKQRAMARARLGETLLIDMQRFGDEGEECLSHMWHHLAHCSAVQEHRVTCYRNAITSLQSASSRWQKVEYLLEFGEWLYWAHFPAAEALSSIRQAEDILLLMQAADQQDPEDSGSETRKQEDSEELKAPLTDGAVKAESPSLTLSALRDVQQLEGLLRVHTLLASVTGGAPAHLQHCLLAYTCALRIWQVSLGAAGDVITDGMDSQAPPSASAKRDKDKKPKEPPEEKPKRKGAAEVPVEVPPPGPEEWARYDCPPEVRLAFRRDRSPRTLNRQSVSNQTQTLYFLDLLVKELNSRALTHLTLPVLHLAEVIAHDLMDSRSVSDLYRLRIARACSQLRLNTSASYHEKRVGPVHIYEEERMACREAMASSGEAPSDVADEALIDSGGPAGSLSRRWAQGVWIEKAEILLRLGRYQPARELLAEAHLVSTKLGDRTSQAKSLLLLAELANQERHHGQALALLREAQAIGGDEDFWYHVTQGLVKATVDGGGEERDTQACQILEHASTVLQSVLEERPNRGAVLRFLVASLETRRAVLQVKSVKTSDPEWVTMLTAACEALRNSADEFLQLGHQEHGAEAVLEQAQALRILAKHAASEEVQQRHLLDSYFLMQQAVSRQQEVALTSQSLLPAQATRPLSLPAVRALLSSRLALAGLGTAMLEQVCREQREREQVEERMGPVERRLEHFLQASPDLTSLQREWQTVSRTLGQTVLTQLQTAVGLSADCVEDRAASLCMLGRCLHLLAVQKDPLFHSSQWESPDPVPTSAADGNGEEPSVSALTEKGAGPEENHEPIGSDQRKSTPTSARLQAKREAAQQLFAQASETLAQAVSLCLQHQLTHILPTACLTALQCYGQYDPSAAGQYLALYQSCLCCGQMAEVLRAACSDSTESQLSALLNLHTNLQGSAQRGEAASTLLGPTKDRLTRLSKAYVQLNINPNHMSIVGELPTSFKILLLQHSEDGAALYGACFEKGKPADSQRGKSLHPAAGTLDCSTVAKVGVCPATLSSLRDRARSFKREAAWATEGGQRAGNSTPAVTSHPSGMASQFSALVQDMEGYLLPLLSQLPLSWVRGRAPTTHLSESVKPREKEERSASGKVRSPVDPGVSVVLLVDSALMELPLEALSVLQEEGVSSVSRDFSIQLFHARLQKDESVESERKEAGGGRGGKVRADQSKAFKGVPVNRVLPPDSLPVDTHNVKYVVDPYNEAGETGGGGPVQGMGRILEAYGQQMTALWEGILSPEHSPSLDELEHLLGNCSGFIFNGTERFLASVPPSRILSLQLSDCQMVMLFDQAQTSSSALRQTKLDELKSPEQLALQGPLWTAALLSLAGVRAITLNQWHSTFQNNTCNMDSLLERA